MERIITDFTGVEIDDKPAFGANIYYKMSGNPYFPNPDVPLSELRSAVDLLRNSVTSLLKGGVTSIFKLYALAAQLDNLLRKQALYVERVAGSNIEVIKSAGYHVGTGDSTSEQSDLKVNHGEKNGSVNLMYSTVPGVKTYIWQYYAGDSCPENESDWITKIVNSKPTAQIDNLASMKCYWFRVAINTFSYNASIVYSQPVSIIVL